MIWEMPITDVPDVRYTRSGDVAIAYQIVGNGDEAIVLVPMNVNIWSFWFARGFREFIGQLADRRRVVLINPRGVGLSDRPRGFTVESRMDDIRAVMDAVGLQRPILFGVAESAATCGVFTATYPERVSRLVLYAPYRRGAEDENEREQALRSLAEQRQHWGEREQLTKMAKFLNPQWADDPGYLEWSVWNQRLTASPSAWADFLRMTIEIDVGDVLRTIRIPALVLSKERFREEANAVAALMPRAEHVVLPGEGYAFFENDFPVEAIEQFLAGTPQPRIPDTVLATLLFTDLVGSTSRAAEVGDRAWRDLLGEQRGFVRRELERYRGEEVDTAGDGFLARFDGPARAIVCAQAIIQRTRALGLDIRAGVHTGECELVDGKPAGLSVHVGARVAAAAQPNEVLVSSTVRDLVAGSDIDFADRGTFDLKGVPGQWKLYAVRTEPIQSDP